MFQWFDARLFQLCQLFRCSTWLSLHVCMLEVSIFVTAWKKTSRKLACAAGTDIVSMSGSFKLSEAKILHLDFWRFFLESFARLSLLSWYLFSNLVWERYPFSCWSYAACSSFLLPSSNSGDEKNINIEHRQLGWRNDKWHVIQILIEAMPAWNLISHKKFIAKLTKYAKYGLSQIIPHYPCPSSAIHGIVVKRC